MGPKLFIIFSMLGIVSCLGSSIVFLLKDQSKQERMVHALSWRVGLSIALFIGLFVAYSLGYIQPHNIGAIH